jgi:O-antigen/teichoic acid export membrane protein
VAFPFLVEYRDQGRDLGHAVIRSLQIVAFASVPFLFGLAAAAPLLIDVLIGNKWAAAATPMTLLCCAMPLRLCNDFLPNAMQAIGRNRVLITNQLTSLAILPPATIVGCQWGMRGLATAMLIGISAATLINTRRCLAEFGLGLPELMDGVWRTLVAGILAALGVNLMLYRLRGSIADLWLLIGLAMLGAIIYAAVQWLINRDQAYDLYMTMRGRRANAKPAAPILAEPQRTAD